MSIVPTNDEQLRAEIRARYGKTALQVQGPEQTSAERCCEPDCCTAIPSMDTTAQKSTAETSACCGSSCCSTHTANDSLITSDLYSEAELGAIPLAAALASLGCGNPTVLAELKLGERVLDLGSGGGIDAVCQHARGLPRQAKRRGGGAAGADRGCRSRPFDGRSGVDPSTQRQRRNGRSRSA